MVNRGTLAVNSDARRFGSHLRAVGDADVDAAYSFFDALLANLYSDANDLIEQINFLVGNLNRCLRQVEALLASIERDNLSRRFLQSFDMTVRPAHFNFIRNDCDAA